MRFPTSKPSISMFVASNLAQRLCYCNFKRSYIRHLQRHWRSVSFNLVSKRRLLSPAIWVGRRVVCVHIAIHPGVHLPQSSQPYGQRAAPRTWNPLQCYLARIAHPRIRALGRFFGLALNSTVNASRTCVAAPSLQSTCADVVTFKYAARAPHHNLCIDIGSVAERNPDRTGHEHHLTDNLAQVYYSMSAALFRVLTRNEKSSPAAVNYQKYFSN